MKAQEAQDDACRSCWQRELDEARSGSRLSHLAWWRLSTGRGREKKRSNFVTAIGTRDQVKLGSRSEDCTGMGDRRLGVFESEAQEQELSQVELPRELLREAQGWLQGAG